MTEVVELTQRQRTERDDSEPRLGGTRVEGNKGVKPKRSAKQREGKREGKKEGGQKPILKVLGVPVVHTGINKSTIPLKSKSMSLQYSATMSQLFCLSIKVPQIWTKQNISSF